MRIKHLLAITVATIVAASVASAQSPYANTYAGPGTTAIFVDDLQNGSSINNTNNNGPGGTPNLNPALSTSYTSYDINAPKGTGFTPKLTTGDLNINLPNSSSSFIEAQALFASTPTTLVNAGDYIDFLLTYTDTTGLLSTSVANAEYLSMGLYDAAGGGSTITPPYPGNLATMTTQTGGAEGWTGYYTEAWIGAHNQNSQTYYRPIQNNGTGSQTLSVNSGINGAMVSYYPLINGGTTPATLIQTNGVQYTEDFRITLMSGGGVSVSNEVFLGGSTAGICEYAFGGYTNLTDYNFDGLAFGYTLKGTGNVTQDVSLVEVTMGSVPEPSTWLLIVSSLATLGCFVIRRRR